MATADTAQTARGGEWLVAETDPATVTTREGLSEEHRLIEQSAAEFMDGEVLPALERLEAKDWALNRALIEKSGALGLLGTNVPESYGGVDLDKVSTMLVSEQIARSASFAATFGAQANLTILPIYMFGTEAQKSALPAQAGRRGDGRRLLPQRVGLRARMRSAPRPGRCARPTAATCCRARRCGSPTAASPTSTWSSPRWTASTSPPSWSSAPGPVCRRARRSTSSACTAPPPRR